MPALKLSFLSPTFGFWDGGLKSGGTFSPEHIKGHPGRGNTIRWGCFELNFWFNCGSGRSWKEATFIAKRRLYRLCKVPHSIEVLN